MNIFMTLSKYDDKKIHSAIKKAMPKANGIVAENILADCREYVPYHSGALQRSGQTRSDGEYGYVEWGTDAQTAKYARVQYEGDFNHKTVGNAINAPRATKKWVESAKRRHLKRWNEMYKHILTEEAGFTW